MPPGWNAAAAVAAVSASAWNGRVWRAHNRRFAATDHGGSLRTTGRYHRGPDLYLQSLSWPALYFALGRDICIAEVVRQITPQSLSSLRNYRISELEISLQAVLDARDPAPLGLTRGHLCDDADWTTPHLLAMAVRDAGLEGMLVPSATGLGNNLIVFPDCVRPGSVLEVLRSVDPSLLRDA